MLALKGIYQNGVVVLDKPLMINKSIKVIVTFVDEEFSEYEQMLLNMTVNKAEPEKKGLDLSKFSFLQSIEATKDFTCLFSEAITEERRSEL